MQPLYKRMLMVILVIFAFFFTSASFASDKISIAAEISFCYVGSEVEWTARLDNQNGPGGITPVENAGMTISLDKGFSLDDSVFMNPNVTNVQDTGNGTNVTVNFGDIQAGSIHDISLKLKPYIPGTLNIGVNVTGNTFDPNTSNNSSSVQCQAEGVSMKINGVPSYDLNLGGAVPYQFNDDNFELSLSNNYSGDDDIGLYVVAEYAGQIYSVTGQNTVSEGIIPIYMGMNIPFSDVPLLILPSVSGLKGAELVFHSGIVKGDELISISSSRIKF